MSETIETLLSESRSFPPSDEFRAKANASDPAIYDQAEANWIGWWESWAATLDWDQRWETTLEWEQPFAKWFIGGKLNACHNCVDRHVANGRGNKVALIGEGEPGEHRDFTYLDLKRETSKLGNALKQLGIQKGDRVCIYMPMGPELAIAMLACARIGAVHSVVFGGFSAESLVDRINDASAKLVITADGSWRRGSIVPLKKIVNTALPDCPTIENVIMFVRTGHGVTMTPGRDHYWEELVDAQSEDCPCEPMDSEDLLFILYTSGSTGKPKGIMHTTGGYLTGVTATSKLVFDFKEDDVYFCTADCGWITGHSYVVYGPLANGVTQIMYEGAPDTPNKDRFWKIVEKHRATILYTAPTAIRTFMKWGEDYPNACDLSSLRLLGTVGEPINPEAWVWYHRVIGRGRCPVVDTWWQTETGSIMITPLPGITACKPGSATRPFPGVSVAVYNEDGKEVTGEGEVGGFLVLKRPWPSMLRGIWGDPDRYRQTYWGRFSDAYFAGDGCKRDADGYFWLLGRVDDIMLVAGHNISTMEVESALVDHPGVAEAAVIGRTHEVKGQAVAAFVILRAGYEPSGDLHDEIRAHVASKIGPIARPDDLFFTAELPKTRSGKIMRRLLRDVAEGRVLGDTTTLADPNVVNALKAQYEEKEG